VDVGGTERVETAASQQPASAAASQQQPESPLDVAAPASPATALAESLSTSFYQPLDAGATSASSAIGLPADVQKFVKFAGRISYYRRLIWFVYRKTAFLQKSTATC